MTEHFVCEGDCKSISETAGVCTMADCKNQGMDMKTCKCEDGEHKESAPEETEQ